MIDTAFNLLKEQLGIFINGGPKEVVIGSVAAIDTGGSNDNDLKDKIILSLVNIEEETALKNGRTYVRTPHDVTYQNLPVFLNLYMLITASYTDYNNALIRLSDVIRFFQAKASFSQINSPRSVDLSIEEEDIQLYIDLFSMSFEQLNHLWGSLGGKQWPSVLYKVRLVRITDNRISGLGGLIQEIGSTEKVIV